MAGTPETGRTERGGAAAANRRRRGARSARPGRQRRPAGGRRAALSAALGAALSTAELTAPRPRPRRFKGSRGQPDARLLPSPPRRGVGGGGRGRGGGRGWRGPRARDARESQSAVSVPPGPARSWGSAEPAREGYLLPRAAAQPSSLAPRMRWVKAFQAESLFQTRDLQTTIVVALQESSADAFTFSVSFF